MSIFNLRSMLIIIKTNTNNTVLSISFKIGRFTLIIFFFFLLTFSHRLLWLIPEVNIQKLLSFYEYSGV